MALRLRCFIAIRTVALSCERNLWDEIAASHQPFFSLRGKTQDAHTMCVSNRLLFYSKCTGFTVCFTYNDISVSMYIAINVK